MILQYSIMLPLSTICKLNMQEQTKNSLSRKSHFYFSIMMKNMPRMILYYYVLLQVLLRSAFFFQVEVLVLILYTPGQGQNYLLDIGNLSHQNLPSHLTQVKKARLNLNQQQEVLVMQVEVIQRKNRELYHRGK